MLSGEEWSALEDTEVKDPVRDLAKTELWFQACCMLFVGSLFFSY